MTDRPADPYVGGQDGYPVYRVPALARTQAGTLLAFAEARPGPEDFGSIETVLRRSSDGGRTWDPLRVLSRRDGATWGNPAPVVLSSGRILLLTCRNAATVAETDVLAGRAGPRQTRRVFEQHSDDDGASWSPPREITREVKRPDWRWYATGPGPGVVTADGGVVVPANHSVARRYGGHCLVSDDDGATWAVGLVDPGDDALHPNETAVVRLADGRLYLNCRNQEGRGPGTRADACSTDGGLTLTAPYRPQPSITTPMVQGALLALPDGRLLYSGPTHPVDRVGMGVRVSTDDGATWGPPLVVDERPAAYSSLVMVDDDIVGLAYETGDEGPYERLAFVHLSVADLETTAHLSPTRRKKHG